MVYQFDDIKVADADDLFPSFAPSPTVVQLSEEMKNAAPELGETQLVQSYEITVKSFSTGICRLDVAIMYEGDGQKKVAAKWSDAELSYLRRCRSYFAIVASSAAGDTYRIKNLAEGADITGELTATSGVVNRASARRRASELRCTPPIPRARLA
ncbi:hypothetical protein CLV47_11371 [Antricoccus suffuscus]|uniref:Uncharacterized protein n=1 Tax=Antricoccus suffuscus TaxID=1629062 RepID=A0A2T0ZX28_9ACTN|nr:hypothetical protein CLV47_11371 [Antricoccus suffuscus]